MPHQRFRIDRDDSRMYATSVEWCVVDRRQMIEVMWFKQVREAEWVCEALNRKEDLENLKRAYRAHIKERGGMFYGIGGKANAA
jgi:hypothetical protein